MPGVSLDHRTDSHLSGFLGSLPYTRSQSQSVANGSADVGRDVDNPITGVVQDDSGENEKAFSAILQKHTQKDVETLIAHYFDVSSAALGAQARATRTALRNDHAILEAVEGLRGIDVECRASKKRDELAMYPHLSVIFDRITSNLPTQATRKFLFSAGKDISPSSMFPLFPTRKPDFLLVDRGLDVETTHLRWHQIHAIVEVKCPATLGPPRIRTMVQVADEARLQLSAHPFRLFSISIIIHGSRFSIVVVDRGGLMYSPPAAVYDGDGLSLMFIAIVQQLAHGLTDRQLGLDPTAEREPTATPNIFPAYRIQPRMTNGGQPVVTDVGQLATVGKPIWSSMSLFGRGSTVWEASSNARAGTLIVKTAWRHRDRLQESSIYEYLRQRNIAGVPGIASFVAGGDVTIDPGEQSAVSVNAFRPGEARVPEDIVLHRVILSSSGKPLWEWENPRQLLLGFLAIVKGIEALDTLGITHRDISAGNVLLSVNDPRPGYEGFVSDFEFAKIPGVAQERPGPTMTGTLQYMAFEILDQLIVANPDSVRFAHATHHDLESLIYTFSYAAYRWVYKHRNDRKKIPNMTPEEQKLFLEDFERFFGCVSVSDIRQARANLMYRTNEEDARGEHVLKHIDAPIPGLCQTLLSSLQDQYPKLARKHLSPEAAADPRMAEVSQLVPDKVILQDRRPPPVYLTCAEVKKIVNAFITVYFPDAAPNA